MGLRNLVDYRGHYLLDVALARARCRIEIAGSQFDRERAREVLTELGWSPTSQPGTGPDDRDTFARDIRTGLGPGADAAVAQRLQAELEDGLCDAQVALVSLERIRYRQLHANRQSPGPAGLTYSGRPVDTLTTFAPAPVSSETPESRTGDPNPTPPNPPGPLTVLMLGCLTFIARVSRPLLRFIYRHPWLRGSVRWLTAEPPVNRNWRLAVCGIAAAIGFTATARWVEVGDNNDLSGPFAWFMGWVAGLVVVLGVCTALANLATRTILHALPADVSLPDGHSRWQATWWIDSTAASIIGAHSAQLIKRSATVAYLLSALAGSLFAGPALWLLSRLVFVDGDQFVALVTGFCVLVIGILVVDMVRARHRSHTRPVLARIASLLAILGLGGIVLRLPAYAYFGALGYPSVAFEITWHEAVLHAEKFLIAVGVSALMVVVFWMTAPRLPRWMQTPVGLVLAVAVASAVFAQLGRSERIGAAISADKMTTASSTRIAACLIEGSGRKPVWVLSQPTGRLLIGDRGVGDPVRPVSVTELRLLPASVTIQMHSETTCS